VDISDRFAMIKELVLNNMIAKDMSPDMFMTEVTGDA
jgi:hypothetical protein